MLCSISFLPTADVIQGFEELVGGIRNIYNEEADKNLLFWR